MELNKSVQFSSVTQLCPTLCDPMDCSMSGFPVHHQLLEPTQTYVHGIGDYTQYIRDFYNSTKDKPGRGTHVYLWRIHFDIWQN